MVPLRFYVFAAAALCAVLCLSCSRAAAFPMEDSTPILVIPPERLVLGIPLRSEQLRFGDRALQATLSPAIAIEWSQRWSDTFGTFASYELRSEIYDQPADLGLIQYETATNFPRAGARLFLAEKQELSLAAGAGERFFASGMDEYNIALEKHWIPELRLGSRNRLFRLGANDLVFDGTISYLGSSLSDSLSGLATHPGFGSSAGLFLERAVNHLDLAGAGLQYEYEAQGTSDLERRSRSLWLGAYYGLSFLN
jgi:hypothetical protein